MQTYDDLERAYIGGDITQEEMREHNLNWARQIEMQQAAIDGPEDVAAKSAEWKEYDNPREYEIGQMVTIQYSMKRHPWYYAAEGTMGLGMIIATQPLDRTVTVYWNVTPQYPKDIWNSAELHRLKSLAASFKNSTMKPSRRLSQAQPWHGPKTGIQQTVSVLTKSHNTVNRHLAPWRPAHPYQTRSE